MRGIISGSSKRGQDLLARANHSEGTTLYHVYDRASKTKIENMEKCKELCYQTNGRNFHIISHNSFQFSVAWEYDDPDTGEVMTRIETANNTYIVDGSRA